jgi:nitronate monooxygenase
MKALLSKLRLPVIQAPMAGHGWTSALAGAVANVGCVGSLGFAYSTPPAIEDDLKAARSLAPKGVLHANFFVYKDPPSSAFANEVEATNALKDLPFCKEHNIQFEIPRKPYFPDLMTQLEPIWKFKPQLLSFHFGIPSAEIISQAKRLGILVGITATSVKEMILIHNAGADFVIAQGIEAGGHRGIMDNFTSTSSSTNENELADENLSLETLIVSIKPHCKLPIIAAGGIMTGYDISRMLNIGVSGVQMGTAFLTCTESGTSPAHRRFLLEGKKDTTFTKHFSGRKARGLKNEFIEKMLNKPFLPFPVQNFMTGSMRKKAKELNNGEYESMWAGSRYRECRNVSAAELINQLELEYKEANK